MRTRPPSPRRTLPLVGTALAAATAGTLIGFSVLVQVGLRSGPGAPSVQGAPPAGSGGAIFVEDLDGARSPDADGSVPTARPIQAELAAFRVAPPASPDTRPGDTAGDEPEPVPGPYADHPNDGAGRAKAHGGKHGRAHKKAAGARRGGHHRVRRGHGGHHRSHPERSAGRPHRSQASAGRTPAVAGRPGAHCHAGAERSSGHRSAAGKSRGRRGR